MLAEYTFSCVAAFMLSLPRDLLTNLHSTSARQDYSKLGQPEERIAPKLRSFQVFGSGTACASVCPNIINSGAMWQQAWRRVPS